MSKLGTQALKQRPNGANMNKGRVRYTEVINRLHGIHCLSDSGIFQRRTKETLAPNLTHTDNYSSKSLESEEEKKNQESE